VVDAHLTPSFEGNLFPAARNVVTKEAETC